MAKQKSPAFQFYPSNFLGSPKVRAMNAAEIGVYWLLCCIEWEQSGFTYQEAEDTAASARVSVAAFGEMWTKLSQCFVERSKRFYSPRLTKERAKQREWRRKSSIGGKISAQRRLKGGSRVVQPPPQPTGNTPSLSPTPTPKTTKTTAALQYDQLFEEAWAAYPKRPNNNKPSAWRQWLTRVGEGVEPLEMLEGTRRYAQYVEREHVESKFIRQGATFFGRDRHFSTDYTAGKDPFAHLKGYPVVVDDFGCMTEYGERVTRPEGLRLA